MKIPKFLLGVLVTLSALLFFPYTKTEAAEFHFKSYTLEQGETVKDDVYVFGESAEIKGVIDGDLIVAAENIKITGTVTGDIYAAGNQLATTATVYGNTFFFGNNITVDGVLNSNLYVFGNHLTFLGQASKDVMSFTNQNTFKGAIGDDLRAFSMSSTINSIVRGDLLLFAEKSIVDEEKISRDIYYDTTIKSIAKSQGIDLDKQAEIKAPSILPKEYWGAKGLGMLISFVTMLLSGAFLIWLTPVKSVQIRRKITDSTTEFIKSLLTGLGILLLVPFPLFLLLISVIGAPVAGLIFTFIMFVLIFGRIWVELAFGKEILELFGVKEYRPFRSLLIGRLLSIIVNLIPYVRTFYNMILVFVSLGAMVRMKKDFFNIAKEQKVLPAIKKEVLTSKVKTKTTKKKVTKKK
ncbi:MAG: polymer-forming cytoskeletal protein [Candidatus Dojkabacteria bacterium]|jgi:hypothetical protein